MRLASYDPTGRLLTRVDGRGVVTSYTYDDPENRLTNIAYTVPSGSLVPSQPNSTMAYDGFGRLASVDNGVTRISYGYTSGTTSYAGYDDYDKPLNVQTGFYRSGAIAISGRVSYGYYANGSTASMSVSQLAYPFTYTYDAAARLTGVANPYGDSFAWTYLANDWLSGSVSKYSSGGNIICQTAYTYNSVGELTDLLNATSSGNRISEFGYDSSHEAAAPMTYDAAGNRKTMAATLTSSAAYSGSTTYQFDVRDELTSEASTRIGGYANSFAYDGSENATTMRSVSGVTYNSDNQLTASGYAFDGNGNPTTYRGNTLVFDVENRMVGYGSALTNGYGANGLRAWKTDGVGTTYYLYNDEDQPVLELNGSGSVIACNTVSDNGLLARYSGGSEEYYAFDPQGSTAERINSSGSVDTNVATDAFGLSTASGSASDPYTGFGAEFGYYTDSETGMELLQHRYYDPACGRFINRDPIGYSGGLNLYDYCLNKPLTSIDDTGFETEAECIKAAGDRLGVQLKACKSRPTTAARLACIQAAEDTYLVVVRECAEHARRKKCPGEEDRGPTSPTVPVPIRWPPEPEPAPEPAPAPEPDPSPTPAPSNPGPTEIFDCDIGLEPAAI